MTHSVTALASHFPWPRTVAWLLLLSLLGLVACSPKPVSGVRESSIDLNELNKSAPPVNQNRRKKQLQQFRKYID